METIDKTTIKPDEVWIIRSKYAYGDQIAVRDFTATWLAEGAVNWRMIGTRENTADKYIELVRKLVPEPTGWETIRAAADVFAARGIRSWEGWLRDHADRLEAEHDAKKVAQAAFASMALARTLYTAGDVLVRARESLARVWKLTERWDTEPCVCGYRIPNGNDDDSQCLHCAADSLRRALDGEERDHVRDLNGEEQS